LILELVKALAVMLCLGSRAAADWPDRSSIRGSTGHADGPAEAIEIRCIGIARPAITTTGPPHGCGTFFCTTWERHEQPLVVLGYRSGGWGMRRDPVATLFWALRWHEGRRVSVRVLYDVLCGDFALKSKLAQVMPFHVIVLVHEAMSDFAGGTVENSEQSVTTNEKKHA
jgi:hypothetical protein